ncbi:MAG: hypothetical protein KM310_11845 [Clostridiales bacterium]|nr:hypothetical protein [Clostridiales bacterium]
MEELEGWHVKWDGKVLHLRRKEWDRAGSIWVLWALRLLLFPFFLVYLFLFGVMVVATFSIPFDKDFWPDLGSRLLAFGMFSVLIATLGVGIVVLIKFFFRRDPWRFEVMVDTLQRRITFVHYDRNVLRELPRFRPIRAVVENVDHVMLYLPSPAFMNQYPFLDRFFFLVPVDSEGREQWVAGDVGGLRRVLTEDNLEEVPKYGLEALYAVNRALGHPVTEPTEEALRPFLGTIEEGSPQEAYLKDRRLMGWMYALLLRLGPNLGRLMR